MEGWDQLFPYLRHWQSSGVVMKAGDGDVAALLVVILHNLGQFGG